MATFRLGHAGQCYGSARHGAMTTSNMFSALSLPEPAGEDLREHQDESSDTSITSLRWLMTVTQTSAPAMSRRRSELQLQSSG